MKLAQKKIIASISGFILALFVFCYPYNWLLKYRIEKFGFEQILKAADENNDLIKFENAIKGLSPKKVYRNGDGIFIKFDEFFVTEDGIFILDKNSTFKPQKGTDPSFKRLSNRLFWYHISGWVANMAWRFSWTARIERLWQLHNFVFNLIQRRPFPLAAPELFVKRRELGITAWILFFVMSQKFTLIGFMNWEPKQCQNTSLILVINTHMKVKPPELRKNINQ